MMKYQVRTTGDALAYITDCTLATVCDLAMKKSRPKHEYARQKSIAQSAVDWMAQMGVDPQGTRAEDVLAAGTVDAWASTFEPKQG